MRLKTDLDQQTAERLGGFLRKVSTQAVGTVIGGLILAIILALKWEWTAAFLEFAWGFLAQPITLPLIIPLFLVIALVTVGFRRLTLMRKHSFTGPSPKHKVAIGSWVTFGPVSYRVAVHYPFGKRSFHATGPFCSKCLSPAVERVPSHAWYEYQCNGEGCRVRIQLPHTDADLKKRAEGTIEGAWNKALSDGGEPLLEPKPFSADPTSHAPKGRANAST